MINLYLIRHAESEINLTPEIIGGRSIHSPLTTIGKNQALALGKHFAKCGIAFDHVFASPAERAKETARLACTELGYPTTRILLSEDLHEVSKGAWEGQPRTLLPMLPYTRYWHFRPPLGESYQDSEERMYQFLEHNITTRTHTGNIAVFGHENSIKALLRRLLAADPLVLQHVSLDNTSITHLQFNSFGWRTVGINEAPHLRWIRGN